MRQKDHKRLVIGAQKLIRKAAELGVIDLTGGIYEADFSTHDPDILNVRNQHYLTLLAQVGIQAVKAGNLNFADEVTSFAKGVRKGAIKGVK